MTDSFAVHLGGGAYLDASGKLVFGSPDNAQIYEAPGGFRLDTKKIQDAFKDLSGLLPADDAAKKKWTKWGVPADVVDFLAKIAGVASIVATAIAVKDGFSAKYAAGGGGNGKQGATATGGVSIHLMGPNPLSSAVSPLASGQPLPSDSIAPPPMQVMSGNGPLTAYTADDLFDIGDAFAIPDASLDKAERRHVKIESVYLYWQLDWKAERLEVRLFGKPEHRPFQVHVVLEETVYSGEALPDNIADPLTQQFTDRIHTPFVAEVVNQLVFVPEELFDEERKAIARGAKMWHDFIRRFAESRPIGPVEPIEFLEQAIRAMTVRSQSTATLAETIDRRVEFAQREAPDIWRAILNQSGDV